MTINLNPYLDRFNAMWSEKGAALALEIIEAIKREKISPANVEAFIRRKIKELGIKENIQEIFSRSVLDAASNGIGAVGLSLNEKRWFLDKAYSAEGVRFSRMINDVARVEEMVDYIKVTLKKGESLSMAAQTLADKGIQGADVAQDVRALAAQARGVGVLGNDPTIQQNIRVSVNQVQRRINTLVRPDKSKLKRAYQDVVDAAQLGSQKAAEKAAYYSAMFKQRYNAERVLATESARAYGKGFFSSIANDGDVIGWRSVLNSGHTIEDICDFYAEADLYGMGAGCYPKGRAPDYPYHPFCTCSLEPLYEGEAEVGSYEKESGKEYLESLDEEKAIGLLGVRGYEEFQENPDNWQNILKLFTKPKKITGLIPERVLRGGR